MHRILKQVPNGMVVDHINRNKLDNRQENLRIITQSQNMQNVRGRNTSISGLRGVSIERLQEKIRWRARLKVNGKEMHLGTFDTKEEAERVVIEARKKFFPYSYEETCQNCHS
ncbi:HNH endonuclease [Rummeliibacillus sp. NPDC094406]|uniref:HNH endonuclease n=1 Tax=Rummeliibacillus sp. NPDC094406 TaxID=3364511 RepID=UPI00382D26CC